ncbi:MAG TPA: DMT family transporter [Gammaproteobacteria bacterium]|nr:DMT family transporter [Gammaproteobacteria bacterium]
MRTRVPTNIILLFIFIVLTTSFAWPINKVGVEYLSPLWYTAIRMIIGTVTMTVLVILMDEFTLPSKQDFPLIAIIGLLQISLFIMLANLGLTYLPAGRASLFAYTTPLWIMPAATLFFGEINSPLKWLGFSLGVSGLFILLSPWEMNWNDKNVIFGTAMLLLASLSWAISMLCARYMQWTKSALQLMPWQLFLGTIPVIILAWLKEPLINVHFNTPLVLSLFYTGVLVTGLSYWSSLVLNRALPTTLLSLGFLLVPVFSLLISSVYLHESISLATGTAMGMILVGLGCVAL